MIDIEIPRPERSLTAYLPCGNKTQTEKNNKVDWCEEVKHEDAPFTIIH